ncbi:hypothetical protein niasHT_032625 [Heterodera trifolii]|uniref:BTB domain-containing protein n=1 Tax=Heterodera trifolii TaxID=157864 RepID=A0ABD2IIK6_9BILA
MSDADTLAVRMKCLLCAGVDADVHFLVGQDDEKELLPAHKPILRVSSDVFDAMFRFDEQKKGDENPIEIPDVDIEAFKTMLNFIYTDNLSAVNGNNAIDVLYAAKKYNLPTLVKACVGIPVSELHNVFIAFAKARLLAEKLIVSEEIAIWNAAIRWADAQCTQNGKKCSGENRREMLGTALYKIRFPIIRKDCLANIVSSGVLTSAELVSVLLYHSSAALSESYPLAFPIRRRSAKSAGKLTLKIDKFTEFAQQKKLRGKYSSAVVYIGGFQWTILAQNETKSGNKYLGFFVQCNAYDYGSNWSCSCSATLRIVSTKAGKADLVNKIEHKFCSKPIGLGYGYGYDQFTSYEALMSPNNGWYNKEEDTVTLSADLTMYE